MIVVGHRGARGLAPENTVASLTKALQHQAAMVEFDVRVTSDQVPVLHHNSTVRINQQTHAIKHTSYKQLRQLKPDLTTLAQALDCIGDKAMVYIEVKPKVELEPIINLLLKTGAGSKSDQVYLASFSQSTLQRLHQALPKLPCVVLGQIGVWWSLLRARRLKTKHIALYHPWLWRGFIGPFARRGWKIYGYSINSRSRAERLRRYGLYAVITDYPDRFEN